MSKWNDPKYDDEYLAEILSDYHKDVHGFRVRMHGESREALVEALDSLDRFLEANPRSLER